MAEQITIVMHRHEPREQPARPARANFGLGIGAGPSAALLLATSVAIACGGGRPEPALPAPASAAPTPAPSGPVAPPAAAENAGADSNRSAAGDGASPTPGPASAAPAPASSGPVGRVTLGTIAVTGGTIANANDVVSGLNPAFTNCYEKTLATNSDAAGNVSITIRVGLAGQILGVTGQRSEKVPATLMSCLTTHAALAEFAPPEHAKVAATIAFPVKLEKP